MTQLILKGFTVTNSTASRGSYPLPETISVSDCIRIVAEDRLPYLGGGAANRQVWRKARKTRRETTRTLRSSIIVSGMYSPEVIDHFEHPRNAGAMDSPDVTVQTENPACGDVMRLMLRVEGGKILDAKFQVRGCVTSIACGSALTEALVGKSLAEAGHIKREWLVNTLGGLSNESMHASHMAVDCLRLALRQSAK